MNINILTHISSYNVSIQFCKELYNLIGEYNYQILITWFIKNVFTPYNTNLYTLLLAYQYTIYESDYLYNFWIAIKYGSTLNILTCLYFLVNHNIIYKYNYIIKQIYSNKVCYQPFIKRIYIQELYSNNHKSTNESENEITVNLGDVSFTIYKYIKELSDVEKNLLNNFDNTLFSDRLFSDRFQNLFNDEYIHFNHIINNHNVLEFNVKFHYKNTICKDLTVDWLLYPVFNKSAYKPKTGFIFNILCK